MKLQGGCFDSTRIIICHVMFRLYFLRRFSSAQVSSLKINEKDFKPDNFTNVSPKILELSNRKLYLTEGHPLSLIRQRIINYFYKNFKGRTGNSFFSIYDHLDPIVTTYQNFDSLLVPKEHASRSKSDCYYINKDTVLRSHMTAHQSELIKMGLNNFLMVGDVYRKDEIDKTHYPVFHQLDGVRLFSSQELLHSQDDGNVELNIMRKTEERKRSEDCQECYTVDASKKVEEDLKSTLIGLSKELFGDKVQCKWVPSYFPFTHPSWELEILLSNVWVEVLGCGIVESKILKEAGCEDRIGWAFGLGLERLAMILYDIKDIRVFWSTDTGFLCQFAGKSFSDNIKYKPVSVFPQCKNHISFWIPDSYTSSDFYDLIRNVGGDYIEQVSLIDNYENKKNGLISHCYEIIYRHPEKTFTKSEINELHKKIADEAVSKLNVKIR